MSQPSVRWEWVNSQISRDFPDSRLADQADDLTVTGSGLSEHLSQGVELSRGGRRSE